jgi:NAD(P)-dependent dehydrogenase (short-subunit alcohol dehydrogenase family)
MSQRVMITAAASGIGRSIAKAFHENGAKVHICDVSEAALAAFREEFPDIGATHVNVTSEAEIEAWFDDALEDLGGLDVMVNNAGIKGPTAPVDDIDFADWRECLSVGIDSYFLCSRRAAPLFKDQKSGAIINLSSTASAIAPLMRRQNGRSLVSPNRWPLNLALTTAPPMPFAPARSVATGSIA